MKKLKLRKWVKVTLAAITILSVTLVSFNNLKERAEQCDKEKGYVCSIYELRNY